TDGRHQPTQATRCCERASASVVGAAGRCNTMAFCPSRRNVRRMGLSFCCSPAAGLHDRWVGFVLGEKRGFFGRGCHTVCTRLSLLKASSVPGMTQTAVVGSSDPMTPRVPVPKFDVRSLSPTAAGLDLTCMRL